MTKRIDYKSETRGARARVAARPNDAAVRRPLHVSTASGLAAQSAPPAGRRRDRRQCDGRCQDRSRRQRALARRQGHTPRSVEHDAQVLDGHRLRARGRATDARHHGNRLGGKPRRPAEHGPRGHDRQGRRRVLQQLQARQVPHADRTGHRARHGRHLHFAPGRGTGADDADRQSLAGGVRMGCHAARSRPRSRDARTR